MVRLPLIHRFRFSLRTFLGTLMLLSLIGSNLYVSFKWRQAQGEIQRLRDELGYLTIDDPTRFYVREVPTFEPLSWQWRIYVPPGDHDFCLQVSGIPKDGMQHGTGSRQHSKHGKIGGPQRDSMQGEYTMTARIERDQHGNWVLAVSYPHGGHRTTIMPPINGLATWQECRLWPHFSNPQTGNRGGRRQTQNRVVRGRRTGSRPAYRSRCGRLSSHHANYASNLMLSTLDNDSSMV